MSALDFVNILLFSSALTGLGMVLNHLKLPSIYQPNYIHTKKIYLAGFLWPYIAYKNKETFFYFTIFCTEIISMASLSMLFEVKPVFFYVSYIILSHIPYCNFPLTVIKTVIAAVLDTFFKFIFGFFKFIFGSFIAVLVVAFIAPRIFSYTGRVIWTFLNKYKKIKVQNKTKKIEENHLAFQKLVKSAVFINATNEIVLEDKKKLSLIILAALRGDSEAQWITGCFFAKHDYEESVRWLSMAAKQGHKDAIFVLDAINKKKAV